MKVWKVRYTQVYEFALEGVNRQHALGRAHRLVNTADDVNPALDLPTRETFTVRPGDFLDAPIQPERGFGIGDDEI